MAKRLQIVIGEDAFERVDQVYKKATEGQPTVKLNYSNVIEEMILNSKVSISDIRSKHTDLRKTLLDLAKRKDISVEDVVSQIADIKGGLSKRETKKLAKAEVLPTNE